jgi:hypothetical protein
VPNEFSQFNEGVTFSDLHAFLFKFARVMSQSMSQWTIIRTYSFYSVARDAEVVSVYTQEWDGELSDLDVETKELELFDPLNLPAMPQKREAHS